MARPALSAHRGIDVVDLLAAFPDRGFTFSEIARATKINVASCHAVLNALEERGYLTRCPTQRSYTLGPALVAIGQAAFKSQPLVQRATAAAEELSREVQIPVNLTARVGDEILLIASTSDGSGRVAMNVGQRLPLVAPIGTTFLAWSSEDEIEAWINRNEQARDTALVPQWRSAVESIRARGFQVILRTKNSAATASFMAELALSRRSADYKNEFIKQIGARERHIYQPESIEPDGVYDAVAIVCPLFDQNGHAAFNLSLGEFPDKISGAVLLDYVDRLMHTCLRIMRTDRSRS